MGRSPRSDLTRQLREAHAACEESAATRITVNEVVEMRAERRGQQHASAHEAVQVYNDAVKRVLERGAPKDHVAKEMAFRDLKRVSRRDFLKGTGKAVPASPPRRLWAPPCFRPTRASAAIQPSIAIVGGGLAGIRCAHRLWNQFKWTSTVYEATPTVGGRLETNRNYFLNGQIAEMHGEFISSEHTSMLNLVKLFNLTLDDTHAIPPGAVDTFWFNGARYTQSQLASDWQTWAWALFNNAVKTVPWPQTYISFNATGKQWDNMSVPQWVAQNVPGGTTGTFGKLCLEDVISEFGGDPADQSALNLTMLLGYNDSGNGKGFQPTTYPVLAGTDERLHTTGGNDQLVTKMISQLPAGTIKTGQALVALKNNGNGTYTLTFQSGAVTYQVTVNSVVLALPFKTLRNVDLSQAGLSSLKMTAINNLGMGTNGKIMMQFNGHPWITAGYNANTFADSGFDLTWEMNYQTNNYSSPTGLLTQYTGGVNTPNTLAKYGITNHEGVPPTQLVTDVLTALERVLPGVTAAYNGTAWYHFGNNDPFVQGAYSYWRVGQYTSFSGYEGVQEGFIHFAGEHTEQNFQGFMEGAVRSGARAAGEIGPRG